MIREEIAAVLVGQTNGLRFREIAAAVSRRLGEPVAPSSVKSCLWCEARNDSGQFERISRGRYRLRSA